MPRRSIRLLLAAVVPLALLVAACGGGGDGGDDASSGSASACPVDALKDVTQPVDITVWSNFTALSKRTFERDRKQARHTC